MTRRQRRLEDVLQREVSSILMNEVADPRAQLATVTRVEVSADLGHAQLFVSVLEGDDSDVEKALANATGFVRHQLAQRLRNMKRLPELVFHLDHGAEHSQHIADLLDELKDDGSDS